MAVRQAQSFEDSGEQEPCEGRTVYARSGAAEGYKSPACVLTTTDVFDIPSPRIYSKIPCPKTPLPLMTAYYSHSK